MSTENNFINELKFDLFKDKIKLFLVKHISKLIIALIILLVCLISFLFIKMYKNNKLEKYNNEIYKAIKGSNSIADLEKIYNDKSAPRISKTLSGFRIVDLVDDNNKKSIILEEIYKNEKDNFFKYLAGISLLTIEINKETINENKINILINELDNKENPLNNLFLEQKGLFLLKTNKKQEAHNIFNNLLNENINENFKARIKVYLQNAR